MSRKFSSLLLTGKAASLPLLFQNAYAQQQQMSVIPSFTDILTATVSQFEMPKKDVLLKSLSAASATGYDDNATICTDGWTATSQTSEMSVVVTGLRGDDTVFLATSTGTGGNEGFHADVKVGTQKLLIPVVATVGAPAGATVAMTIPLKLADLKNAGYNIAQGGSFYMQTAVFPKGAIGMDGSLDWSKAKISKLDRVGIGKCSTYGSYTY